MSRVTEQHRAVGSFELAFRDLPQHLVDRIDEFGHIAITTAREDALGDNLLSSARYVGVVNFRRKASGEYDFLLRGVGMGWWLGTADKSGDVIEDPLAIAADTTFADAIRQLLPAAVLEGTLDSTGLATYTGTHLYQTRREAIDYVCDTVSTGTARAEWRVRGDGRIDAGPASVLYGTEPRAVIVRKISDAGEDMTLRAFPGPAQSDRDTEAFTTRVVILGKVEETTVVEGTADIDPGLNPYRDLHGNVVKLTRLISESSTEGQNATARAQIQLDELSRPQTAVVLDTGSFDMRGTIAVGADVWVHDPQAGIEDPANEIVFRGQRLNPAREQVTAMTWPVTEKMGCYYRSRAGEWLDLSRWVDPVDGQTEVTTIEIGRATRGLTAGGSSLVDRAPTGPTEGDTTVPGVPVFVTPFPQALYQGDTGVSRGQIQPRWSAPVFNTDGTSFLDGSHYEVRRRISPAASSTWGQVALKTWGELLTWGSPIAVAGNTEWEVRFAAIDADSLLIGELTPGTRYEFQIRAVDTAQPTPNAGAWSSSHFEYLTIDNIPPATPAAPEVAGSLIQISVLHRLGNDQGGTFNLALDLNHLEVHRGSVSTFTPDLGASSVTRLGKVVANRAQITGQIPVIGTFPVDTTAQGWVKVIAVDDAGNRSGASASAAVTAELIDSQWVSDLIADKITAGSLLVTIVNAGEITSGPSGTARYRLRQTGLTFEDSAGNIGINLDAASNSATLTGTVKTGRTGRRAELSGTGNDLRFYPQTGETRYGRVYSYIPANYPDDIAVEIRASDADTVDDIARIYVLPDTAAMVVSPQAFDQVARSRLIVTQTSAAAQIFNVSGTGVATHRCSMVLDDTGAYMGPRIDEATRDGGYLSLQRATAFLGHSQSGNYVRVDSSRVELITANQFRIRTVSDGVEVFDTVYPRRIGGYLNGRVRFKADAGDDVFWYWGTDGALYLGGASPLDGSGTYRITNISKLDAKTFVIDHPAKPNRHLVHATTESPHAGVEYWGTAIVEDGQAEVVLPDYFEALTHTDGRSVQVTVLAEDDPQDRKLLPVKGKRPDRRGRGIAKVVRDHVLVDEELPVPRDMIGSIPFVQATYPTGGRFTVWGHGEMFTFRVMWLVKAIRRDIPPLDVEPLRSQSIVRGDGPYTYLESRTGAP